MPSRGCVASIEHRAQGLTADHVVLATTRETLDQLAARASDGRLDVQIATKFHPHQASRVFSAYAARSLAGKHVMQGKH
jgi:hypothetical protein